MESSSSSTLMMMMRSTTTQITPLSGPIDPIPSSSSSSSSSSSPWKLYDNPHYSTPKPYSSSKSISSRTRSSYHSPDLSTFSAPMPADGVIAASPDLSDLDNALAEIKDLRAQLDFERRMRRKAESLNRSLAREVEEERRAREAAEGTCRRLAEEVARAREAAVRVVREVEDERKMMRTADMMREERVQMKLSEARFAMEEKIKEMLPVATKSTTSSVAAAGLLIKNNTNTSSTNANANTNNNNDIHQEYYSSSSSSKKEVENPHIKRGIKGMEFPRAVRVRVRSPISREGGGRVLAMGSNLECQRAQMRVLMRNRIPAAGGAAAGIIGAADNLVM